MNDTAIRPARRRTSTAPPRRDASAWAPEPRAESQVAPVTFIEPEHEGAAPEPERAQSDRSDDTMDRLCSPFTPEA